MCTGSTVNTNSVTEIIQDLYGGVINVSNITCDSVDEQINWNPNVA